MIGIVVAMEAEIRGLNENNGLGPEQGVVMRTSGMGRQELISVLDELHKSYDLSSLIAAGFSGGLNPELRPGDICLAETIRTEDEQPELTSDPDLLDFALNSLEPFASCCNLLTVGRPIDSKAEKKEKSRRYNADIVDMESYWIARFARDNEIPFLGIRTIVDPISLALPPENCYNSKGQPRFQPLLAWIIKNPARLAPLFTLMVNTYKARRQISQALQKVVTQRGDNF